MPSDRHLVLHHVVIKGIADEDAIGRATDLDIRTVRSVVELLLDQRLLTKRTGRLVGFTATVEGRELHAHVLAASDLRDRKEQLCDWYSRFEVLNGQFKAVCTAWQLRECSAGLVVNDHSDPEYDRDVISRLDAIHDQLQEMVAEVDHPRLRRYLARLDDAFSAVSTGDFRRFTAPLCESYHDAWMELHHDLLMSFGRQRTESDT